MPIDTDGAECRFITDLPLAYQLIEAYSENSQGKPNHKRAGITHEYLLGPSDILYLRKAIRSPAGQLP